MMEKTEALILLWLWMFSQVIMLDKVLRWRLLFNQKTERLTTICLDLLLTQIKLLWLLKVWIQQTQFQMCLRFSIKESSWHSKKKALCMFLQNLFQGMKHISPLLTLTKMLKLMFNLWATQMFILDLFWICLRFQMMKVCLSQMLTIARLKRMFIFPQVWLLQKLWILNIKSREFLQNLGFL